ncbi:hypothetical protein BD830_105246 [Maritimibacter alkaliphilus HTCC2654]|uniref:hypothetical protein n=1 Tax=Maritimibacter alkaliphilus TaxID=404236 RepID=UPI000322F77D|nr:hypothetical protein [Maritimibacter alkaliphilus]TYP81579.1 hypothetical protein BD830_105246 [Maritimibacter alkaliphilus HTCC2654]
MARKVQDAPSEVGRLTNSQVAVLAAYLAGASRAHADTEDIAVKAAELAPGRFSWRKYPEQINIETIRKRLWDASSEKMGRLLTGSERDGWLLTEAGLQFCREHSDQLENPEEGSIRLSQKEQAWATRERGRMQAETAFRKWKDGLIDEIQPVEAERFFRIDDYIVGELRRSRVKRARDIFAADQTMSEAINEIAKKVRDRD